MYAQREIALGITYAVHARVSFGTNRNPFMNESKRRASL